MPRCDVHVDEISLEDVSEFKYLGCVLDESGTYGVKCGRKVASGRRVAGAIYSLVNAWDLQFVCARDLHETLNAWIRQLCGVKKGLDERINEGVLRRLGHVERMERVAKRVYVGECAGRRSVGRQQKRWIDTVKECLRKSGLDKGQARRMVQDRTERRGFIRGNAWGVARGMNL